jgi:hypothetical protein
VQRRSLAPSNRPTSCCGHRIYHLHLRPRSGFPLSQKYGHFPFWIGLLRVSLSLPPTIPPTRSSHRSTLRIPLRSLHSHSEPSGEQSTSLLKSTTEREGSRRSSLSSPSADSDFSVWTDTGDLAEQLADEEDPLQISLDRTPDDGVFKVSRPRPRGRRTKQVHYQAEAVEDQHIELDKEAIEIPRPSPRPVSRAERILAAIMSPSSRQTAHGLVGKPLLCVPF